MIRLSKSSISDEEIQAVTRVLRAEYLGMGDEVKSFEQNLELYFGGQNQAVCVSTGTAAIHLALQAIGVSPGDEVLVPTMTYVATFQAVTACGATAIACDVTEKDVLIDLEDAERKITKKTKAIIPVHYAGHVGNLNQVYDFAKTHNLRVIEDAAHAFGTIYQGKKIGSFGDIVCFSFDGIKNITSGEGGAILTSDEEVLERVKNARLLGVIGDTVKRYNKQRSWFYDVDAQGWRYHMSNIMAAIGQVQLKRSQSDFLPKRQQLARRYHKNLQQIAGVELFETDLKWVVPHIMPIKILHGKRDEVCSRLLEAGIETGIHYKPNHYLTYFKTLYHLPVAESLYEQILTLPLHVDLSEEDVDFITDQLADILNIDKHFVKLGRTVTA